MDKFIKGLLIIQLIISYCAQIGMTCLTVILLIRGEDLIRVLAVLGLILIINNLFKRVHKTCTERKYL